MTALVNFRYENNWELTAFYFGYYLFADAHDVGFLHCQTESAYSIYAEGFTQPNAVRIKYVLS